MGATIYCERESQKSIVIGRRGALLKVIGSEARSEAEKLLGRRMMLRLWVKVRGGWRDDKAVLRELGITE
jgi:GTP-binding protein Era